MKKSNGNLKRPAALLLAAASAVVMSVGVFAAAGTASYIGEEKAKAIALEHAGVAESDAIFTKTRLDRDDRHYDYDVEFSSGAVRFDYEIDAVSGEIMEYETKFKKIITPGVTGSVAATTAAPATTAANTVDPVAPATVNNATAGINADTYIGDAKAKSIALTDAGVAEADVRKMKVELDREHRTMVYEVDFDKDWTEYEYEIDAVSGEILKRSSEYDD